jgi:hypothetical protein
MGSSLEAFCDRGGIKARDTWVYSRPVSLINFAKCEFVAAMWTISRGVRYEATMLKISGKQISYRGVSIAGGPFRKTETGYIYIE